MGGNGEVRTDGLTPKTAVVINNNFGVESEKELKKVVESELQRLLNNGEISKDEAKAAMKYLRKDDIAAALVRRNNVEANGYDAVLNGFEDLADEKANSLMKEVGLSVSDLYEASRFAGADYEISYTKLSREEKEMAENGEITKSELKNIQNALNEKIKANGGDKVLDEKETKLLMKGLGLSVEGKFNIGKILLSMIGLGSSGGVVGLFTRQSAKAVASTTITSAGVTSTATAIAKSSVSAGLPGLVTGAVIGAGVEIVHQANRKEEAFGEQGGAEAGEGSVTNKTEAKMHKLGTMAAEAMEEGDVPSPPPIENPFEDMLE